MKDPIVRIVVGGLAVIWGAIALVFILHNQGGH